MLLTLVINVCYNIFIRKERRNDMDGIRSLKAAENYLTRKGYKIVGRYFIFDYICVKDNTLVFIDVDRIFMDDLYTYKSEIDRSFVEVRMASWLSSNDEYSDIPLRYDDIVVIVLDEDRAMVRHHINALERV